MKALQIPARGQVFLSNFIFDSRKKRLPHKVIKLFWHGAAHAWDKSEKITKPELFVETYSRQLAQSDLKTYFCQGPKVKKNKDFCSRVIEAQDIITYKNIDISKVGFIINGYISKKQITELETFGLRDIATGEMSSGRSFFWITRTDEIENLRKSQPYRTIANIIRDRLGLLNFDEDQQLIEILFPDGVIDSDLRAPTFIEGNPSLIYKSCTSVDGWGKTCDLKTYTDGLSEAVHHKIKFNEDFQIKYIGQLKPPKPAFDWEKFINTFVYKWRITHIGEFSKYV